MGRRTRIPSAASHAASCASGTASASALFFGATSARTPPARPAIARISASVSGSLMRLRSVRFSVLGARYSRALTQPVQPGFQ